MALKWLQFVWIGAGILAMGWSSARMLELPLWSNWPLLWLAGLWLLVVGLLWRRIARTTEALHRFLLSSASGLLLAIAFPVSPLTPVIFIAFVPLLMLYSRYRQLSYFRFFGHLYNAFFLWNILTTYWILNTSFMPGIVANLINAGLMTVPWLLFKKAEDRFSFRTSLWALIAYWISFEYIHLQWEISWPWLNIGNAFAMRPAWIQWYSWTGVFGGALWIWLVTLMIFRKIESRSFSPRSWTRVLGAILIPVILSTIIYFSYEDKGHPVNITIIQPNYEPHYEKFEVPQFKQIQKMAGMALENIDDSTDFLLLPETVINRVKLDDMDRHRGIQAFKELTMANPDMDLVSGISSYRTYSADSMKTGATRIHIERNGDTTFWDIQNNALWVKNGEVRDMYFKSKLVPGAEIFPYRNFLPFLKPVVDQLGGSVEGHATQDDRKAFGAENGKVAPVICYESVYGEYVGDYIKAGAEAIFIMTNDGWWDVTPGHLQHLHYARLRAVEQRKSIARAANTGISCFINQRGDILQPTDYGVDAIVRGHILFNDQKTWYNRWGDFIAWAAIIFSIFFVVASFVPSYYLMRKAKD